MRSLLKIAFRTRIQGFGVRRLRYIGNKSGMISSSNQLDKIGIVTNEKL